MSTLRGLKKFSDRGWYAPLIGLLAGMDQFIVVVPIEWLMIPNILFRPKNWLRTSLIVTTGCALGALALAALADVYGATLISQWAPSVVHSAGWARSTAYINQGGAWALLLVAASPLPQQPAVALAGLSHMSLGKIFAAIWVGRAIKYCSLAFLASHAPTVFNKLFPKKFEQKENHSK